MPKKHTPGFKTTKPQAASHSSLASRSEAGTESHTRHKTVNERLQELRISQGPRTTPSNTGVHAPISGLGDAQPQRRNLGRIAGPPPPRSWTSSRTTARNRQLQGLESSRYAYEDTRDEQVSDSHPHFLPPPLMPNQPLPQARSLRATALRLLSQNLSWHVAYQQEWLDFVLTTRIKCELLTMLALGSLQRLNKRNMRYLLGPQQDSYGRWSSGGEGITHLSFGAQLKQQRDYMNLAQYLKQESSGEENAVPDSWDETNTLEDTDGHQWSDSLNSASDSDPDTAGPVVLKSLPPNLPFLPSLTHLSLARPSFPYWSSLVEIGSLGALCHLTHLDLSYWPSPTLTASIHNGKLPLSYVGSALNSTREDEAREVIRIFNQLGKACRKLIWLGLEGCETWLPSLMAIHQNTIHGSRSRYDIAGLPTKITFIQADWTGVWRGLETLKVAQSWIPQAFIDSEKLSDYTRGKQNTRPNSTFPQWWVEEQRLRTEELRITQCRLEAKQPALKFEKTPIQSWIELEIRSLSYREAAKRWKESPLMQQDIYWDMYRW